MAAHLLDEPRRDLHVGRLGRVAQLGRLRHELLVGRLVEVAFLEHAPQDVAAADLGRARIAVRRVGGRRLGQTGQQRRLGDVELRRGNPEVRAGRLADPVGAMPEVDLFR